jgi:hypothetical protein
VRFMRSRLRVGLGVLVTLLVALIQSGAQGSPRVTGTQPDTAKVGDSVTVTGENLTRTNVSAVFLSDNSDDFKASVVEQASEKIVIKVPKVKAGAYNISIQIKNDILIQPVRITIQE